MTKNKYVFIGLVLIILGVFIWLGYVYYSSRPEGRGSHKAATSSSHNPTTDNQPKPLSHSDITTLSTITKTTSSIIKQDYQPTETEKLFYRTVVESLKPKLLQKGVGSTIIVEDRIISKREIYKAFPPRKPYAKRPDSQYYQGIIMNLQELIKQCPDSPYYPHYQETFNLIIQMQKEDELFYDKNAVFSEQPSRPLDEKIPAYIHCLRYSYFYKTTQYKMEFGDVKAMGGLMPTMSLGRRLPTFLLSGAKLVEIGASTVPSLLNILEDRRPIIAADDTKMPAVFYRYQDAAVEILQRMFIKAKQPFPLECPEGEYFSEYLSKQTPENKQKILNDIKAWVEESMKNPTRPEEQTPISNDKK